MATQHTHQVVFGRKVDGCPRCDELKAGAPARQWANQRATSDARRLEEIRAHFRVCSPKLCGPVCTRFEW